MNGECPCCCHRHQHLDGKWRPVESRYNCAATVVREPDKGARPIGVLARKARRDTLHNKASNEQGANEDTH